MSYSEENGQVASDNSCPSCGLDECECPPPLWCRECHGTGIAMEGWDCEECDGLGYLDF